MAVSTKSVSEIISKLECEKSAGLDGIDAEYLKFPNIKIHVLLKLLSLGWIIVIVTYERTVSMH